jgi:hypothetical protein
LLVSGFLRGLLELHEELVGEVEREFDPGASMPPESSQPRQGQAAQPKNASASA